jgi:hypothetical protein
MQHLHIPINGVSLDSLGDMQLNQKLKVALFNHAKHQIVGLSCGIEMLLVL